MKEQGTAFHEGVPNVANLKSWFGDKQGVLVMEDVMSDGGNKKDVLNLFIHYSYHHNVTVLYLCQDLFPTGKYAKTISRNVQYIIAIKRIIGNRKRLTTKSSKPHRCRKLIRVVSYL